VAYPDLVRSPTFWRCPKCANETLFLASGTAHVECVPCGHVSTVEKLLEAHAQAHPTPPPEAAPAPP
jgi:uncharacterized protein (DUF983 family)